MSLKSRLRSNTAARSLREFFSTHNSDFGSSFDSIVRNLERFGVTSIFDVGANVGQFGIDLRRHGFEGQIFSFEPVEETFQLLSKNVERHQPWEVFQLSIGSDESESFINISGNAGLSSSILEMGSLHLENFPKSATVRKQKVTISTIDKQLELINVQPKNLLLKLDVQGFEAEVLKGASRSLSKIPLCYLEVSIAPLYIGEIPLLPMLNELDKFGHQVIDIFRGAKTRDGRLLQVDILTKNSNA